MRRLSLMSMLVTLGITFAAAGGFARAEPPVTGTAAAGKADDDAASTSKREKRNKSGKSAKTTAAGMTGDSAAGQAGDEPVAADNTGVNKRDRDDRAVTADQQKNNKSDVELTAEIRRAIVKDDSLSTNAHNVKIVVQNGQVTLKGPVASAAEKAAVERKASAVVGAGKGKIVNEIAVAP